ncbi:hypothetical protein CAL7716_072310 [Calothrix sp. PCC 7716]|nr:hypothetical protein CAL7716_072310 [Calothrix sp. PCC 7716]
MATKGPTKGGRILVKLPFGETQKESSKENAKSQYVAIKENVAKALGFKPVDKMPTVQVKAKIGKGNAEVTITRLVRGAYKRRSVKLLFKSQKSIGGKSVKTVSLPLPSGVTMADVAKYFNEGAGKAAGVSGMVTPDGIKVQWDTISIKK